MPRGKQTTNTHKERALQLGSHTSVRMNCFLATSYPQGTRG